MTDRDVIFTVVFATVIILLLVAGIIITIFVANKQRLQQAMKITQMELDYEKELRITEAEISEQVFTQVSRELHDNIGQLLTLMRLQIENKKMDDEQYGDFLQPVEDTLISASEQVRQLSRSLNTDVISQRGLAKSLEAEVQRLQLLKRPAVAWQYDNMHVPLDKNQQLIAFRIFQEMTNNSLKHSRAKNLSITLTCADGFYLEVRDDGKGFSMQEVLLSGNVSGLNNMKKRAALAGFELFINSMPGEGCSYVLKGLSKA